MPFSLVTTLDGAQVHDSKPDEKVYTLVLTDIEGDILHAIISYYYFSIVFSK